MSKKWTMIISLFLQLMILLFGTAPLIRFMQKSEVDIMDILQKERKEPLNVDPNDAAEILKMAKSQINFVSTLPVALLNIIISIIIFSVTSYMSENNE